MLRCLALGLALSLLAAACALTEPPPGTVRVEVEVHNRSHTPVEGLGIKVPGGMVLHAVEPPSVPADSTTMVTFHVPIDNNWWIAVNGIGVLEGEALRKIVRNGCPLSIECSDRGAVKYDCGMP